MLIKQKILLNVIVLLLISLTIGFLDYLGNQLIPYLYPVPSAKYYLYEASFLNCLAAGAITCGLAYSVYGILLLFTKVKIGLNVKIIISVFSYFVIFIIYAAHVGQTNFLQPFIIKIIIVYICAGILTPVLESYLLRKYDYFRQSR